MDFVDMIILKNLHGLSYSRNQPNIRTLEFGKTD